MKQIILKDKRVMCVTSVPYSKEVIREMKYKVTEIKEKQEELL